MPSMPSFVSSAMAVALAVSLNGPTTSDQTASDRLAEARTAMGGAARLAAVKTLSLSGVLRTRNQLFGKSPDARTEFILQHDDISALFPDHFVQHRKGATSDPEQYAGFARDTLLNRTVVPPGWHTSPASYPASQIETERGGAALLLLPLLLKIDTVHPFTLRGVDGDALVFEDAAGRPFFLEIDPATKLPRQLRWESRVVSASGTSVNKTLKAVLEIGDYRAVGDLLLPHKLVRRDGGVVSSEREIDSIQINPVLGPEVFAK